MLASSNFAPSKLFFLLQSGREGESDGARAGRVGLDGGRATHIWKPKPALSDALEKSVSRSQLFSSVRSD